jgi:hypothetical protein
MRPIGTISARRPRGHTAYTVSKDAVIALTKPLRSIAARTISRKLCRPRTGLYTHGPCSRHDRTGA